MTIRPGVLVPLAAYLALWKLQARGFWVAADDGALLVAPKSRLTAADDRAIRRHRINLVALAACGEAVQ